MSKPFDPRIVAAQRRAAKFLVPALASEAERADAFKRAGDLLVNASRQLFLAGREDLAKRVHATLEATSDGRHGKDA